MNRQVYGQAKRICGVPLPRLAAAHHWRVCLIAAAALLGFSPGLSAEQLQVAATIKPVHSLVSAVMAGVATPGLVIKGATSPHNFAMRPSSARMLEQADVVFLVGEAVETSVMQSIVTLAPDARVVELAAAEGMVLRRLREGGNFERNSHTQRHAGAVDGGQGGTAFDMHVWLDPVNAGVMVRAIAEVLGEADPGNAATYAANAERLQVELRQLGEEVAATLAPVQDQAFLVFHDAYQHFEARFGLFAAGSAVVSADRSPGVRRIRELRAKVQELGVTCVMFEPQFDPRIVHVIAQGTEAKVGSVDPLGSTIDSGPEFYATLLRNVAASFKDCL
ncbi:MAG: zinc ABC transporter substrate-binding protein [Gammaproteobacteria bacterium]|nr:zinc ABC transporter substrate-binding protein [Gammaproteobacteria bacterium]